MESWGWSQFLSILPCLVNEFLTFISTNHSLTSSPHWFLLQYSRIPWLAFFPTPKSLTQKCLSYGHPVPYLKFNESTIPFLTILFWFLVTYITESKSWTPQRRPPATQCLSSTLFSHHISLLHLSQHTQTLLVPCQPLCCPCPHTHIPKVPGCVAVLDTGLHQVPHGE